MGDLLSRHESTIAPMLAFDTDVHVVRERRIHLGLRRKNPREMNHCVDSADSLSNCLLVANIAPHHIERRRVTKTTRGPTKTRPRYIERRHRIAFVQYPPKHFSAEPPERPRQ